MKPRAEAEIEILCPALLEPVPEDWIPDGGPMRELERLLTRTRPEPEPGFEPERLVFARFGLETGGGEELPAGALGLLGEGGNPGSAYWLRADPVYLYADRSELLLFPAGEKPPSNETVASCAEGFNRHFAADGWSLSAPHPARWYLRAPRQLAVRTRALREVAGRGIGPFLPRGPDAPVLRRLVAETEMLLHELAGGNSPGATADGRVNSLWLSGGGCLPESRPAGWTAVVADDPMVRGLGVLTGAAVRSLRDGLAGDQRCLCWDDGLENALRRGDGSAFRTALAALAKRVADGLALLASRRIDRFSLGDAGGRRWVVASGATRWGWRRRRSYGQLAAAGRVAGGTPAR